MSLTETTSVKWAFIIGFILCSLTYLAANPVLSVGKWVNLTPSNIDLNAHDPYSLLGAGITVDPNNPDIIFWCNSAFTPSTNGGLYRTTNAGSTWAKIQPFDKPLHVRINPKNSKQVYLCDGVGGASQGFWKSTDNGITWRQPQGFLDKANDPTVRTADGYTISVDPSDFNHALFSFHSGWPSDTSNWYCGIFETKDGGETWTIHYPVHEMRGTGVGVDFLFSPDLKVGNSNTWLVGCQGSGFFRTTDAGATWKKVISNAMVHGGNQIYYTSTGILYTGAAGWPAGPMRSTDNGETWSGALSGVNAWDQFLGIGGDGTTLYTGGFNEGGPYYTSPESDGLHWTKMNASTENFVSGPMELSFDKINHIMYASTPGDGVLALKIQASTGTVNPASAAQTKIPVSNIRAVLINRNPVNATAAYDIRGAKINSSKFRTSRGIIIESSITKEFP